jgi:enoyl-CoA hydratase
VAADEALAIGLVNEVVSPDGVYERALEIAGRFAAGPTVALMAAKQAIQQGLDVDVGTGLTLERQGFAALFSTEDQRIGMESFAEKGPGKAKFTGR